MTREEALKTLGLSGSPTEDEIGRAHTQMTRQYHPSGYPSQPEPVRALMAEKIERVNEALAILLGGTTTRVMSGPSQGAYAEPSRGSSPPFHAEYPAGATRNSPGDDRPRSYAPMDFEEIQLAGALWAAGLSLLVGIGLIFAIGASGGREKLDQVGYPVLWAAGLAVAVCLLVIAVKFLTLLYRCWAILDGYGARTSPGSAVGLLLVPVINIAWAFVAIHGLALDMHRYLRDHGIAKPRAPHGLSLTYCVLSTVGAISLVPGAAPLGLLVAIPHLVVFLLLFRSLKLVAAAIAQHQHGVPRGAHLARYSYSFMPQQQSPAPQNGDAGGPVPAVPTAESPRPSPSPNRRSTITKSGVQVDYFGPAAGSGSSLSHSEVVPVDDDAPSDSPRDPQRRTPSWWGTPIWDMDIPGVVKFLALGGGLLVLLVLVRSCKEEVLRTPEEIRGLMARPAQAPVTAKAPEPPDELKELAKILGIGGWSPQDLDPHLPDRGENIGLGIVMRVGDSVVSDEPGAANNRELLVRVIAGKMRTDQTGPWSGPGKSVTVTQRGRELWVTGSPVRGDLIRYREEGARILYLGLPSSRSR
jgi:hypothetical protein